MISPHGPFAFCKIVFGLLFIVPSVTSLVLILSISPSARQIKGYSSIEAVPFILSALLACILTLVASVCPPRFLGTGPRARTRAIIALTYVAVFNTLVFLFGF
jgi:hypothetical protein